MRRVLSYLAIFEPRSVPGKLNGPRLQGFICANRHFLLRGFLALCAFQGAIATTDAQAPGTCASAETVLDPSGAFEPNAQISLMNEKIGLSRSLSTASEGLFRAALLIPGSYSIKVTAAGFGTQMLRSVPVVASEITSIEFKLRLSDTSTAVANEHFAVAEELQNA
jgi:hypothetical protein